jgi:PKD repeat protein
VATSPAAGQASPAAAANPEDFEWNLADEPQDAEFEIDADATSYFMPVGNVVTFKAKALNGTPPFTFTWNFGDGSESATGELVKHTYNKLGRLDAIVTGTDASGASSLVQLGLLVVTPEDWAKKLGLDAKVLENYPSPSPDPVVTP